MFILTFKNESFSRFEMGRNETALLRIFDGVPRHGSYLELLWKEEALCDVSLRSSDGYTVKCHKVILASVSPFFKALFTGAGSEMRESSQKLIELRGITSDGLHTITSAIYTNQLELTDLNLKASIEAAEILGIASIKHACIDWLHRNLEVENCLETLQVAEIYSATLLHRNTIKFIRLSMSALASHESLGIMMKDIWKSTIVQILQNQSYVSGLGRDLLRFVLEWIRSSSHATPTDGSALLESIRVDPMILEAEAQQFGLQGVLFFTSKQRTSSRVICVSDTLSKTTGNQILVAGGHDTSWRTFRTTHLYDPQSENWTTNGTMPGCFSLSDAAVIGNNVFIVGGSTYSAEICRFDIHQGKWFDFPDYTVPRIQAAVTSLGQELYVCGGRTGFGNSSVYTEIYQFGHETNKWIQGPDLCQERFSFGATSLGSDVFAVGGQSVRNIHNSVEVLKLGANRWLFLESKLSTPRKYLSVTSLAGRIFAIGGMNAQRVRLSSVEALDPREGRWIKLAELSVPRSSCGVAIVHDEVFVVGGNSGDTHIHSTMECYIPKANAWVPCKDMNEARSALSAVCI
eukprot:g6123.t1